MELVQYIQHPELLDRESLFDLRNLVARYPYHQAARLLMLQNLYLLHDPTFDEELRRSAFYITDRNTLFNLVEAAHYKFRNVATAKPETPAEPVYLKYDSDRTGTLIDIFLDSIPAEPEPENKPRRKPTPADAAIDYMAYVLETEKEENELKALERTYLEEEDEPLPPEVFKEPEPAPEQKVGGFDIIDNFLENEGGKIEVNIDENAIYDPERDIPLENDEEEVEEGYFTETLAKIYIKQGRYSKAFEIIQRLNLIYPKKNAYFADQMRFLEKIIANERSRKGKSSTSGQ